LLRDWNPISSTYLHKLAGNPILSVLLAMTPSFECAYKCRDFPASRKGVYEYMHDNYLQHV
jgi:hypothetical protein